jgi:hypothetical protein
MTETNETPDGGRTSQSGSESERPPLEVPCLPPIEIRNEATWLLTLYEPDAEEDTVIGTESTRIEAMREAKNLMDDEGYPCMVLWSSPGEMQDAYWNPLFEELHLKYDPLLEAWAIVPAEGHYLFDAFENKAAARERGREVQLTFDFKQFVVYRKDGKKQQQANHHLIRSI